MNFKIVSWNVENLFHQASSEEEKLEYRAKLASLAAAVRSMAPDVIALQEVGGPEALAALQESLDGAFPYAALSKRPDRRGIRVALLSKRKLYDPVDVMDFSSNVAFSIQDHRGNAVTTLRRGALWAKVKLEGMVVHVITAHLKSKLLDYPTPDGGSAFSTNDESLRARTASLALAERTAEAVTLRTLASGILAENPDDALVLLGDLNDVSDAATTQILQGPIGSQPGTGGFDRPDRGDPARLFNLSSFIPVERRYSRINSGVPELIDHILVSERLLPMRADGKRAAPRVNSYPEAQGGIESVSADPRKRKGKLASDHAPVMAEFEL